MFTTKDVLHEVIVFLIHISFTWDVMSKQERLSAQTQRLTTQIPSFNVTSSFLTCSRNLPNLAKEQAYFYASLLFRNMDLFWEILFIFQNKNTSSFYSHGIFLNREFVKPNTLDSSRVDSWKECWLGNSIYYMKPYWTKIRQTCLNELLFGGISKL